jgi:nucleoside-diphosphate-sugar epimerase
MEKLLFTGGTGFLGKNVMPILSQNYEVTTCGITPDDMIKANLAKEVPTLPERYDVVLHACGKAHVVPK